MRDTLIKKVKYLKISLYFSSQLINSGSHFQIFTETKIFGRSKFSENTKFRTLLFSCPKFFVFNVYLPSKNEAIACSFHSVFWCFASCDRMQQQLKISQNSQENTCAGVSTYQFHHKAWVGAWNYKESFFNKVAANEASNFTKIRLQHRCFPVKFVKFLRTTILMSICQQMLL